MVQTVLLLVCVEELNTRSTVLTLFNISHDQLHRHTARTCRSPSRSLLAYESAIVMDRATALVSAAAALPLLHIHVRRASVTQG